MFSLDEKCILHNFKSTSTTYGKKIKFDAKPELIVLL